MARSRAATSRHLGSSFTAWSAKDTTDSSCCSRSCASDASPHWVKGRRERRAFRVSTRTPNTWWRGGEGGREGGREGRREEGGREGGRGGGRREGVVVQRFYYCEWLMDSCNSSSPLEPLFSAALSVSPDSTHSLFPPK